MKRILIAQIILFVFYLLGIVSAVALFQNQGDNIVNQALELNYSQSDALRLYHNYIIHRAVIALLIIIVFIVGKKLSFVLLAQGKKARMFMFFLIISIGFGGLAVVLKHALLIPENFSLLSSSDYGDEIITSDSQVFLFFGLICLVTLFIGSSLWFIAKNDKKPKFLNISKFSFKFWILNYTLCLLLFLVLIPILTTNSNLIWLSFLSVHDIIQSATSSLAGGIILSSFLKDSKIDFRFFLRNSPYIVIILIGFFGLQFILRSIPSAFDPSFYSSLEYLSNFILGLLLYSILGSIVSFGIWKFDILKVRSSMELASKTAELSNLKSQINPHFLFNSLNSLYGLALAESSPKTSTGIQKLSEMMRFMLRENVEDQIDVSRELEYVENYIELQKLRIEGNDKVKLEYKIDTACKGKITPMLIIPFIENAFKHGVSAHHNSWVDIELKCSKEAIHLKVKNSNHKKSKSTEEESGIGLENVRQRLMMLYPQKHLFQLFESEEEFEAKLKIELN